MDNLAHTLAGAALAEAGLKRRTPLAMATLVIGANLPDLDAVTLLFNSGLAARRGWTHGVLAIALLPILLTVAMLAWDRAVRRKRDPLLVPAIPSEILILAFLGVLSHPFLDWLNSYGLRWLMPFDGRWFYGDALFIVDPWLWITLLLGFGLARRRGTPRPAQWAVGLAALYIVIMVGSSWVGRTLVTTGVAAEGVTVDRVMVGPVPVDPNRREVVIESEGRYMRGTLRWLPTPTLVIDEGVIHPNLDHPFSIRAAADGDARRFLAWARFPFVRIEDLGTGAALITFDDLRYSDGSTTSWAAVEVEVRPPAPVRRPVGPPVIETSAPVVP